MTEPERLYTQHEIRVLDARRECERTRTHPGPPKITAAWNLRGTADPVSAVVPLTHTYECSRCDGVITVTYPPIGRPV